MADDRGQGFCPAAIRQLEAELSKQVRPIFGRLTKELIRQNPPVISDSEMRLQNVATRRIQLGRHPPLHPGPDPHHCS